MAWIEVANAVDTEEDGKEHRCSLLPSGAVEAVSVGKVFRWMRMSEG